MIKINGEDQLIQLETDTEKSRENYQGFSLCLGLILSNHLVAAGFTSFSVLAAANPRDIEIACSKTPPFGNSVRNFALNIPRYRSTVQYTIYNTYIYNFYFTVFIFIFFTLQYTVYTEQIHFCMYNPYFTLYVHCTLYISVCSPSAISLHCSLYIVQSSST